MWSLQDEPKEGKHESKASAFCEKKIYFPAAEQKFISSKFSKEKIFSPLQPIFVKFFSYSKIYIFYGFLVCLEWYI